jgi:phosphoenolpyruvate carboxylase
MCKYSSKLICIAGNPRVTPEVTRDVCLLARMMAANLYNAQMEDLMFEVIMKIYHILCDELL